MGSVDGESVDGESVDVRCPLMGSPLTDSVDGFR